MMRPDAHKGVKALFLILGIILSVFVYLTAVNYVNVTDARVKVSDGIYIQDVIIPPVENENDDVKITVIFFVANPTSIDILVYDTGFNLYMNNLSDPLDFNSQQTWDSYAVGAGGFSVSNEDAILVPAGESRPVYSNLTVPGGSTFIERLNVTDMNGKYHPLVAASLRFTFPGIDVREVARGIYYYSEPGVEPRTLEATP